MLLAWWYQATSAERAIISRGGADATQRAAMMSIPCTANEDHHKNYNLGQTPSFSLPAGCHKVVENAYDPPRLCAEFTDNTGLIRYAVD